MAGHVFRVYDDALATWVRVRAAEAGVREFVIVEAALSAWRLVLKGSDAPVTEVQVPHRRPVRRRKISDRVGGSVGEGANDQSGPRRVDHGAASVEDAVLRLPPPASDGVADPQGAVSDSRPVASGGSEEGRSLIAVPIPGAPRYMQEVRRQGVDSGPDEELGF